MTIIISKPVVDLGKLLGSLIYPAGYSFLNFLSSIKVPKGSREAMNAKVVLPKLHLYFIQTFIRYNPKATNKTPCAHPTYFTTSGLLAKYFKGMAISNNTR